MAHDGRLPMIGIHGQVASSGCIAFMYASPFRSSTCAPPQPQINISALWCLGLSRCADLGVWGDISSAVVVCVSGMCGVLEGGEAT